MHLEFLWYSKSHSIKNKIDAIERKKVFYNVNQNTVTLLCQLQNNSHITTTIWFLRSGDQMVQNLAEYMKLNETSSKVDNNKIL